MDRIEPHLEIHNDIAVAGANAAFICVVPIELVRSRAAEQDVLAEPAGDEIVPVAA